MTMSSAPACFIGSLFESLLHSGGPFTADVHAEAHEALLSRLRESGGGMISLRAPRAGYGKTTLLARVGEELASELYFVPFTLVGGRFLSAESLLEELFSFLEEPVDTGESKLHLTRLDHITRRLFAHGLAPMVEAGLVPCQDRAAALESLTKRPVEAFDFHQQGAAIAQWTKAQFVVLGPRLSNALAKESRSPNRLVSRWLELLLNYSVRKPGDLVRSEEISQRLFCPEHTGYFGSNQLEVLGVLLSLITLVQPIVLVLDEVDGLSGDSEAALAVASTLAFLGQSNPLLKCILSVNQDVWDSAFLPQLPNGLRDRFEDCIISLKSISEKEMRLLVEVRTKGGVGDMWSSLQELDQDEHYPRSILKQVRTQCQKEEERAIPKSEGEALLKNHEISSVYPPREATSIPLPLKREPPQYKVSIVNYPPKTVPQVSPPAKRFPTVYCNQWVEGELPMPLAIDGEGFALSSKIQKSSRITDQLTKEASAEVASITEPSSPFSEHEISDDRQSVPFAET